jgi:hypothetical protein
LNLEVGSLSGAVGIGNAGTGAIFIAASLFGRPLAQPGSSAGADAAAAGGVAGVAAGGGVAGVDCARAGRPTLPSIANAMQVRTFFIAMFVSLSPIRQGDF